jgi:hypothetical protein
MLCGLDHEVPLKLEYMSSLVLDSHETYKSALNTASGTSALSKFWLSADGTVAAADHVVPLNAE